MKLRYKFLLLPLLILISNCSNVDSQSSKKSLISYEYSDIEHLTIEWNQILSLDGTYFVYVYSQTCGHCKEIKSEVLNYAIDNEGSMYFVEYSKDIPILEVVDFTLGVTNYEDVGILGTPTLLEVIDHTLIHNIAGKDRILLSLSKDY